MAKTPKKIVQSKITPKEVVLEEEMKDTVEEEIPAKIVSSSEKTETLADKEVEVDYLRQYQYKKVNNVPTIGGILTDPDKGGKAEKMKAFLLTQKKISTLIPLPEGSDPKVLFSVTLNGYRLDLPTNSYIEIPEQVAEIVRNSNNQTLIALNQFKISGDKNKESNL